MKWTELKAMLLQRFGQQLFEYHTQQNPTEWHLAGDGRYSRIVVWFRLCSGTIPYPSTQARLTGGLLFGVRLYSEPLSIRIPSPWQRPDGSKWTKRRSRGWVNRRVCLAMDALLEQARVENERLIALERLDRRATVLQKRRGFIRAVERREEQVGVSDYTKLTMEGIRDWEAWIEAWVKRNSKR